MSAQIPVKQLPVKQAHVNQSSSEPHYQIKEEKIYTRRISGFYQRLRRNIATPLLLSFLLIPWLRIDERPAIFLDLTTRKFHIFWMTFWPQDGMLLAWLLIISALALFAVTVWVGRVWCGFSCPQTIWTQMFIWIEDKCEGDRQHRIKLDARAWDIEKLLRKSSKHLLWWVLALLTSFTFVAYFYDVRELTNDLIQFNTGLDAVFWIGFFALATYLNAGWMREKMCQHICPYSRFQSVMYDKSTKVVAYDAIRGDSFVDATTGASLNKYRLQNTDTISMKRLPRSPKVDHKTAGLGDCVDCSWCVQVCPVDIDIRDGLQADCINCGLCIDACDNIMDRMNYPRGLIRFASDEELENNLENSLKNKSNEIKSHLPNPRFIAYSILLLIITGLFVAQLFNRTPLDVSISRDRGVNLYHERNGNIENVYLIRLGNMSRQAQYYEVSVLPPYTLKGRRKIFLEEGELFNLPLRAVLKSTDVIQVKQNVIFQIHSLTDSSIAIEKAASFISPVHLSEPAPSKQTSPH